MPILYLHGFASSPGSTKASRVAERLRAHGLILHCPDFNEPDFSSLTVTRMIEQSRRAIAELPPEPVTLIGSSLGGFVAVQLAALPASRPGSHVDRLVLLAPALDFGRSGMAHLDPDGLARWRETDRLDVFHHGFGKVLSIRYALHEDAGRYDGFTLRFEQPTLVYQGRRDQAVDPSMVERFARARPNVTLRMLDDDHQLVASLPEILDDIEVFLGLR
jgi:pimeloyl-ACP methyl ester carboxylesterase